MRPQVTTNSISFAAYHNGIKQFLVLMQSVLLVLSLSATNAAAKPTFMTVTEAFQAVQTGDILLVDVRTPGEWAKTGIGEGAIGLDLRQKSFIDSLLKLRDAHPDKTIAFICATGGRSGHVSRYLDENGFGDVFDVGEGMLGSTAGPGWLKSGLPVYPGEPAEIAARVQAVMSGQ